MEPLTDQELKKELLELDLSHKQKRKLSLLNDSTSAADDQTDRKRERAVESTFPTDILFFKELEETIAYGRGKSIS